MSKITVAIEAAEEIFSQSISIEDVRMLQGKVIDFRTFYNIMTLQECESHVAYGEGFFEGKFCYKVKIMFRDETDIDVLVQRNTFEYEFLNENEIEVDTLECIDLLRSAFKSGYLITGLSIVPPEYIEDADELFVDREIYARGICDGGRAGVDFGSISEVSEEGVRNIPAVINPIEEDREWIAGEEMEQVVNAMPQMETIDVDTFKFIQFLTRMRKEDKISEEMMKTLAKEWDNSI